MAAPAIALGVKLKVLAASMNESASGVIPDVRIGDYRDLATVREFAEGCDLITFDFSELPIALIRTLLASGVAAGVRIQPSADAVANALERSHLLKDDGTRGRQIAVLVARSPHGQAAVWSLTELVEKDGIRLETITPAPNLTSQIVANAQRIALEMAGAINLVGVMAVEMFLNEDQLLVNKLALGPHKSGLWTIDGSTTSQFEQHLRAILDLPLGTTDPLAAMAVTVKMFGTDKTDLYRPYLHVFARDPGVKVHQYGQEVRLGSELGHVTIIGSYASDLRQRAAHAADYISGVIDE